MPVSTAERIDISPTARAAYAVNAAVAWLGVALTALFSGLHLYEDVPADPGLFAPHPDGAADALARLGDTFSYFTIWSNIVVAISATLLLRRPAHDTWLQRVLRLDALLMITVTALVYQVVLAPTATVVGWSRLTDPILHILTPALTVVVWLVWGPRGWLTARLLPAALTIPVLWVVFTLLRGAVIDAYPYGFVNVVDLGYAVVLRNVVFVLIFALVLAAIFWGIEVALRRRTPVAAEETAAP